MPAVRNRYWLALHPDINKPIGGAKQMHRLAEALNVCGREATIIQQEASFHPGWFTSKVSTIALDAWRQRSDLNSNQDVVILPETFLHALDRYAPRLPKVVFNQNGAYTFGLGPGDGFPRDPSVILELYRHPELIHVLCVSEHDHILLSQGLGLGEERVSRLVNAVEGDRFQPCGKKRMQLAYMPRKNQRDAMITEALFKQHPQLSSWQMVPIHRRPQHEVAEILQASLGFLAFGHPEGFGLPLAEAAACGCALIGYSGLGGRELIQAAEALHVGWEVDVGDWQGFLHGALELQNQLNQDVQSLSRRLQQLSQTIRTRYSFVAMVESVRSGLQRWEAQIPS